MSPYFGVFPLSKHELRILREAREADPLKKTEKQSAGLGDSPDGDRRDEPKDRVIASDTDVNRLLAQAARQLDDSREFDPSGIEDARKHVFSSIVSRMGQPAFGKKMLAAYKGRCAMTELSAGAQNQPAMGA